MYEAKIIADSICAGHRLTTMQLTHPRVIHAEFLTHCMFARNASSSRAIPFAKAVQKVLLDPYIPRKFGVNEKGMQATQDLSGQPLQEATKIWLDARDKAVDFAFQLSDGLNVHKQVVNRLIEPWSWITVCVTGDHSAWSNYFALRCHPDADPSIQDQAYMAQMAYFTSTPTAAEPGEWHTPYLSEMERRECYALNINPTGVSVGRCARTSYLTQEGKRDYVEDVKLHDRLYNHKPLHASPFEHVCAAMGDSKRYGKYVGWKAYRHMIADEYVKDFTPNHPELV